MAPDQTQHLERLKEAVHASGNPDLQTLRELVAQVQRDPNTPPAQGELWPIFSYVRSCLEQGMSSDYFHDCVLEAVTTSTKKSVDRCMRPKIKNADTDPNAPLVERYSAINEHLAKVHTVCPLGRLAGQKEDIHYWGLPKGQAEDPRPLRRFMRKEIGAFLEGKKRVMIIAFADNFQTHTEANQAAKRAFCELSITAGHYAYPGISEGKLESEVFQILGPTILDPKGIIKEPGVAFKNGGKDSINDFLFVFAGNNLFPPEDPNYLPFPALVIVYNGDVVQIVNEDVALAARINVNVLTGIACPYVQGVSLQELRNGSSAELLKDGERNIGYLPTLHPAIGAKREMVMGMLYKKGLYRFPIPPELMGD